MDIIGNVNLKLLQTFLVVAEQNSFRAAAEILHRSHSAISAQITQLEDQLDVRLLERTTRSMRLTEEGTYLQASARKAVSEIHNGMRRIKESADIKRGQISLACSSNMASIYMPAVLTGFVRDFPGIAVTVRELTSQQLFAAVHNREVDFAVGPELKAEPVEFETILVEPLQALVPRHFVDEVRTEITLREIAELPMLLSTSATAMRSLVENALHEQGLEVASRYQFIQAQTIIAMAEAGLGVAILPSSSLQKAASKTARILNIVNPSIQRKMALIKERRHELSPAAARLAARIVSEVRVASKYTPH